MFDRAFLTSKLGIAALVSVAAMVTFNVFALSYQVSTTAERVVVAGPALDLA